MKKHYTPAFKAKVVLETLKEEQTLTQIASAYDVHPVLLSKWKTQALEGLPRLFENDRKSERAREATQAQQRDELFAQIGRLTTQLDWLKKKSGLEPAER